MTKPTSNFTKLASKIQTSSKHSININSANAIATAIGRQKYKFAQLAAKGRAHAMSK